MGKAIKMLSVDEKAMTADLDRAGYRKMGMEVKRAKTYEEVERILLQEPIDVIAVNHDYKGVDALSLCKHLKSQDRFSNVAIVVTSVQGDSRTKSKVMSAGADLFIVQPVPRQVFVEQLKRLLEKGARITQRVELSGNAKVHTGSGHFSCPIGDLSASGILLATERELPQGAEVTLQFSIPTNKKSLTIVGEVVRIIKKTGNGEDAPFGMGIRFRDFKDNAQAILESYVTKANADDSRLVYYL